MDESRNPDGTWKEGVSGNLEGRPRLGEEVFSIECLRAAFIKEGKELGMSFYEWCAKRAFAGDTLVLGMLKKFVPDLRQVEVIRKYEGGYADMSPAEACQAMDEATMGKPANPAEDS